MLTEREDAKGLCTIEWQRRDQPSIVLAFERAPADWIIREVQDLDAPMEAVRRRILQRHERRLDDELRASMTSTKQRRAAERMNTSSFRQFGR